MMATTSVTFDGDTVGTPVVVVLVGDTVGSEVVGEVVGSKEVGDPVGEIAGEVVGGDVGEQVTARHVPAQVLLWLEDELQLKPLARTDAQTLSGRCYCRSIQGRLSG